MWDWLWYFLLYQIVVIVLGGISLALANTNKIKDPRRAEAFTTQAKIWGFFENLGWMVLVILLLITAIRAF